jgi:N-acetylglucosaminyldiphosphoundecaprenol N-acetyl-beta-D-mannosaminyltransferase
MTDSTSSIPFINYSIFTGDFSDCIATNKTLINTINQYSFCIAEEDVAFKKALQQSDILLPDGIGIVVAAKILNNDKIFKIAGADVHKYLLDDLNKKGGKCFYLGSSQKTLDKIVARILEEYTNIEVETYSPPYKNKFSDFDSQQMIDEVNTFKPDVLFVGMTAPKQEKWTHKHKDVLDAKIICSIGAVFDFYAGTIVRPNKFWINLGLEWLIRLLKEPKRMSRRYLYYGPVFIKLILKEKVRRIF